MGKRLLLILLMAGLVLVACEPQQKAAQVLVGANNQTWFDAPLEGDNLPLASYEIVLHAYIKGGVSQVELNANGALLANLTPSTTEGNLATFKYLWTPAGHGNYTLTARAEGGGGWGEYAMVNVSIADFIQTPTITPTTTVTEPPTITPTATPTITQTLPAEVTFSRSVSTGEFSNGNCQPNQITVTVQVSDPAQVSGVALFQNLDGISGWDGGTAMNPQGGGSYSLTIYGDGVPGNKQAQSATWLHQLVATGTGGAVVGRSSVFNDVTFKACTPPIEPPRTKTPPVIIIPTMIIPPFFPIKSPTPTQVIIY